MLGLLPAIVASKARAPTLGVDSVVSDDFKFRKPSVHAACRPRLDRLSPASFPAFPATEFVATQGQESSVR